MVLALCEVSPLFTRTHFLTALLSAAILGGLVANRAWPEEPTEFKAEARQQFERGQNFRKLGQLPEAISAYEEAIKLGMEAFPRVHLQQAASNLDLRKYDTAIGQFTKFIDKFGLENSCRH
jgi:tetratricopeptide (TPR) repeat protein